MADAPGLNVVNSGTGDGIVGATTALGAGTVGVHGVVSANGEPKAPFPNQPAPYSVGVLGESADITGLGVYGWAAQPAGTGVYGGSPGAGTGVAGVSGGGTGVSGTSKNGLGVYGEGRDGGVYGVASNTGGATGAYGAGDTGVYGTGQTTGVVGSGKTGVSGTGGIGVIGNGQTFGAIGVSTGTGVLGWSGGTDAVGVHAVCPPPGWAIVADGHSYLKGAAVVGQNLIVVDDLSVVGVKNAVVRTQDGSHRALYCVESPECWFEDFGRARLVRGAARVRLDRMFAGVVRTGDYHVFLSPEGLCGGLYVSRRGRGGFEVRELHQGKSTVMFSYRIVARRKGVDAPRFKRVKLPAPPKPVRLPKLTTPKSPDVSRLARRRQGAARLTRKGVSKSIQRRTGRRRSGTR